MPKFISNQTKSSFPFKIDASSLVMDERGTDITDSMVDMIKEAVVIGLRKKVGFDFKEYVRHAMERGYGGSWLSIFYKPD